MIDLLLVPYDSGHRARRLGAGPLRLIETGLLEHLRARGHDVRLLNIELTTPFPTEIAGAFQLARTLASAVARSRRDARLPVVLAGNCMAAAGIVAALPSPAVYWLDAHADLNTPETTRSGFLDGMALSVLLGRCFAPLAHDAGLRPLPASAVTLVGARDLDPPEREYLAASGIRWRGTDGAALGGPAGAPDARDAYLHLDLDVLDPAVGTANPFAATGGFTVDGLLTTIDGIAARHRIAALALTAYDPTCDPDGAIPPVACRIVERVAALNRSLQPAPTAPRT